MKRWTGLGLLLAACAGPAPMPGRHTAQRIVSTNPCLDAILVELVPPERIAAISHYSQDPRSSSMPVPLARRLPATAGAAEEVIALRPDLVLASSFTPPATQAAYKRLGLNVLLLGNPATIAENKAQIMEIANAVGEPGRGRALVARIDRAVVAAAPPDVRRPSALLWLGASNLVSGRGTLIDEMMTRAGFLDASANYGVRQTGVLPLEYVVAHPPDVVLSPAPARGADPESRRVQLRDRLLQGKAVAADFPEQLTYCGGPTIVRAMARLAAIRREAVK